MNYLFTYIVNFDGGVYSNQVEAKNTHSSLDAWLTLVRSDRVFEKLSLKIAASIEKDMSTEGMLIPLSGLTNAWCFTGLYANKLILGNVVLTRKK